MALMEYDLLRKRQQQQNVADQQTADDAMKRRFASMGALNTGAYVKQQQIAQDKIKQQGDQAMGNIDFAEAQAQRQIDEAQKGRDFQSNEAKLARDADLGFKDKVFQFDKSSKLRELDLADKQFALDKDAQEFNKRLAQMESNRPNPGLLGNGGLLGTGIGAGNFLGLNLGGDGGGGGGTVFCTELHRQKKISDRQLKRATIYGMRWLRKNPAMFYGYQIFATEVVQVMRRHPRFNKVAVFFLKHWADEITGKSNLIGKAVHTILKPISKVSGMIHSVKIKGVINV